MKEQDDNAGGTGANPNTTPEMPGALLNEGVPVLGDTPLNNTSFGGNVSGVSLRRPFGFNTTFNANAQAEANTAKFRGEAAIKELRTEFETKAPLVRDPTGVRASAVYLATVPEFARTQTELGFLGAGRFPFFVAKETNYVTTIPPAQKILQMFFDKFAKEPMFAPYKPELIIASMKELLAVQTKNVDENAAIDWANKILSNEGQRSRFVFQVLSGLRLIRSQRYEETREKKRDVVRQIIQNMTYLNTLDSNTDFSRVSLELANAENLLDLIISKAREFKMGLKYFLAKPPEVVSLAAPFVPNVAFFKPVFAYQLSNSLVTKLGGISSPAIRGNVLGARLSSREYPQAQTTLSLLVDTENPLLTDFARQWRFQRLSYMAKLPDSPETEFVPAQAMITPIALFYDQVPAAFQVRFPEILDNLEGQLLSDLSFSVFLGIRVTSDESVESGYRMVRLAQIPYVSKKVYNFRVTSEWGIMANYNRTYLGLPTEDLVRTSSHPVGIFYSQPPISPNADIPGGYSMPDLFSTEPIIYKGGNGRFNISYSYLFAIEVKSTKVEIMQRAKYKAEFDTILKQNGNVPDRFLPLWSDFKVPEPRVVGPGTRAFGRFAPGNRGPDAMEEEVFVPQGPEVQTAEAVAPTPASGEQREPTEPAVQQATPGESGPQPQASTTENQRVPRVRYADPGGGAGFTLPREKVLSRLKLFSEFTRYLDVGPEALSTRALYIEVMPSPNVPLVNFAEFTYVPASILALGPANFAYHGPQNSPVPVILPALLHLTQLKRKHYSIQRASNAGDGIVTKGAREIFKETTARFKFMDR